jgi:CHASE2 domain-containing sensor protein
VKHRNLIAREFIVYDWRSNWERRKATIIFLAVLSIIVMTVFQYYAVTSGEWLSLLPMTLIILGAIALAFLLEFFGGSFMEGPWP